MKIKAHTSIIGDSGYCNHSRNFFTALNKLHEVKVRNFTVGKSWKGNNETPHDGEMYLSKEHKEMLYEQVLWIGDGKRADFPIYSYDESFVPDVNITLDPMDHYLFHDNYKGYNIGYNIWETTEYPKSFFNLIHKYDQFWVPTKWQKDNLVKQGYPQDKVKIVPEGIDPEVFKPAVKKPADKFRFILFGKWEYRKSTQEILSCFLEVFKHSDDVELIASIDNNHKDEKEQPINKLKDLGLENNKIKLVHFPPASEYIDHLQQGDVFISCARSEGWNLPLIEAMACGVPSIYSNWGAQLEFAEGKGLPVKIKGEIPAINDDGSILPGNYCEPDWEDFKRVLSHSYFNHKALKEKALKDSEEIRKIFTWENAAKIASQHLTKSHFNFESFFSKYKTHIDKKSVCRSKFYEYVIPKLIELGRPIYVLETGTMSTSLEDNSGAFTLIMADLIKNYTGGKIYTVDLSKENIQKCKNLTKEFEEVIEYVSADSIKFIKSLDKDTVKKFDLVYLDSYDLWLPDPHNSAQHHLNELLSLFDNINDKCFVGIDDNYLPGSWVLWNHLDGNGNVIKKEKIVIEDNVVGKGQYCESFLIKNGWIRNESINLVGKNNVFLYEKTKIRDLDTKDKILYISPHLSTGGLPQYLLKKIESLVQDHEIVCVEYSNISTMFTIQKIGIKNILGDKLITLGDRKEQLIEIINTFKPDVIHLEEIPEYFMRSDISNFIYSSSRSYKIIETSHDSSFEIERKIYLPDKFLLVSRYQLENFSKLNIPCSLMEYPIEYKSSINKESAKQTLGMDPNKKHVVNVGLFSSRKNQAEIVEYAKKLLDYPIQFHFIGNQAENFKRYWEPIMQDFPANCTWWGERADVSTFYESSDLFLFTSRGTENDKETSPIVIREAISYGLPSLIYDLPVYMKMYHKYNNIKYLNFDNLDENRDTILKVLNLNNNMTNIKIQSEWNLEEQKVTFSSDTDINFPVFVSVKDYSSNSVIWSVAYERIPKNINFWIIPAQKHSTDLSIFSGFSGIKLCLYNKETGRQIYEKPFFHKYVDVKHSDLSDTIPYYVNYLEYFYDKKFNKFFKENYKNCVDAGANVGVFTKFLIENNMTQKIVSVECDPLAIKDLNKNFKFNSNVKIINKALHYNNDRLKFYHCPSNPVVGSKLDHTKVSHHGAGIRVNEEILVDTVTVRELVNELGVIDLLKVDIEGSEYDIFENMDDELFKYINNIYIECHFFESDYKDRYKKLIDKLNKNGYSVKENAINQTNNAGGSDMIFAIREAL